ncbi:prepilin peptidase [Niallia taxi]|uniref:prepilin peptidase n=1 Tax=Niallia taxi TaxID=2499688 RepID=UPI0015F6D10C|nr:A24 family peptidase [Niallia taxi]
MKNIGELAYYLTVFAISILVVRCLVYWGMSLLRHERKAHSREGIWFSRIVRLFTVLSITASPLVLGWSIELLIIWLLIVLLAVITITDYYYMLIPDKALLLFGLLILGLRVFFPLGYWWEGIVGAVIGFIITYLIALISRGGLGGGDIKLMTVIGLVIGWQGVFLTLGMASFFGAVRMVIGFIRGEFKEKNPQIAFGPFIALSAVVYIFGSKLFTIMISNL